MKPTKQIETPSEQLDLAEATRKISEALQRLLRSGLNRKAIVVLIKHDTRLATSAIESVLDSLNSLANSYTK